MHVTLHVSVWVEMHPQQPMLQLALGHAPRERVSWNDDCCLDSGDHRMSRSTWACELKLTWICETTVAPSVTLHVSVWVEIGANAGTHQIRPSHAPRERVSWNWLSAMTLGTFRTSHAPRERVSWNHKFLAAITEWIASRSTWACELKYTKTLYFSSDFPVTLHVSVWVEIQKNTRHIRKEMSRSTWACELKLSGHTARLLTFRHAPRERVSWNADCERIRCWVKVTLHVSVWVEIFTAKVVNTRQNSHAPRERVSWNY